MSFLFFSTSAMSGTLLFQGRGDDLPYTTGVITHRNTEAYHHVTNIALEAELHEGTRRFRRADLVATFDEGEELRLGVEAQGPSIAMQGLGYSGGYDDGRGLGAWRGESHLESDVWDVSHPSKVVYPDGAQKEHWHRIQPAAVEAGYNGQTSSGTGSMTLTIAGRLPKHLRLKSGSE